MNTRSAIRLNPVLTETIHDADAPSLIASADGLSLRFKSVGGTLCDVRADFVSGLCARRRRKLHNERLLRVGVDAHPGLKVIDATAGLGRDAFILACLGCQVTLLEREPMLVALLEDGLARARASGDSALRRIVSRMVVPPPQDSIQMFARLLAGGGALPDVIYLDPMFEPEAKMRAQVKKESQALRHLAQLRTKEEAGAGVDGAANDFENGRQLLDLARRCARRRIAVKRSLHAEPLAAQHADFSCRARRARFDIYRPIGLRSRV